MNDLEFQEQYKRLKEVHPHFFGTQEKMHSTWNFVQDMDAVWFRKQVDRVVGANDIRHEKYDIREAAIGERRARKAAEFAENVIKMSDAVTGRISDKGLDKVLEKYKSTSLVEAVEKSQKGEL